MSDPDVCSRRSAMVGLGAVALGGAFLGGDPAGADTAGDGRDLADGVGDQADVAAASDLGSEYGTVVDVVEAGGDPTGRESVTPVLREHRGDDTLFRFPPGRYRMAEEFRQTGFEHVGFVGEEATIVPADFHGFRGRPRCFQLGTHYDPGRGLRFEGIDFDFSGDETGVRAIQAQVAHDLLVRDVTVHGEHDSGTWGPFLFDVTDPDGDGLVERVEAPDGGAFSADCPGSIWTGPTGMLVTRFHEGHVRLRECVLGPFPDNGLYARHGARTTVLGGGYRNSNVASIRIGGDGSAVRGTTVVVDDNRDLDENQTGIRIDSGADLVVEDTEVRIEAPNGPAVNVLNDVESATVRGCSVAVDDAVGRGIVVRGGAGRTVVADTDVRFDGGGNAVLLQPRADGGGPVVLEDVSVAGEAHGYAGRHAIRCERAGSAFRSVTVDQRGEGYRRCLELSGDDCLVRGGSYRSTHHPIVNAASGTRIEGLEHAEAANGRAALRLLDGHADVAVVDSVLYGGVRDDGTVDLELSGNVTPLH
jgi:hypothetical protein